MPSTSNPRQRRAQEARRQQAQEQARQQAYRRAVRKRRFIAVGVLVGVLLATVGVVAMATGEKSTKSAASTTTAVGNTTTTANAGNNLPAVSIPVTPAGAALTGDTPCPQADGSSPRTTHFAKAPPTCLDPTKDYEAVIHTTKGDLKVSLLPTYSPNSVNSFVTLARYHYYDGMPATRIVPRGWAEFGDLATGDGTRGPGYTIASETPKQGSIPTPGILAMLPDATGAAGGGLIVGIADQVSGMPANATQIGNITDSRLDQSPGGDLNKTVQQEIDKAANKSSAPTEIITITGIDIVERPLTK